MPEYTVSWVDLSLETYATLPADRQAAVNERLRRLAFAPSDDAMHDEATGWWTTTYGNHTGLLMYGISERRQHLVILRLQDLS